MANTSTGYVNGSDFGIYVGGTLIAVATENSLELTNDVIEVSNKDTASDKEYIPARGDGTINGSARLKYDAGYGWPDLLAIRGTTVTIRYSNNTTGDDEFSFSAILTSLSRTDPDNDNSTISYSFQKSGAVTTTNIS